MSEEPDNHDYEHKASVREHGSVRREKEDPKAGLEPITLSLFTTCAAVLIVGGAYVGAKSGGFDFGRVTTYGPEGAESPPGLPGAVEELGEHEKYLLAGEQVYKAVCNGCHQVTGGGQGQIPPLVDSEWVDEGTERLAQIVLNGMRGPITVNGASYGAQEMPAQKGSLSDDQVAKVMTYVRHRFGGITDSVVTKEMAAEARERHGAQAAVNTVASLAPADAMLPGDQPEWMNPEPAAGEGEGGGDEGSAAAPEPGT